MILLESIKGKRYKCPYCETRLDRVELVNHIEKTHPDFVSDDYSAARQVFNLVNKKTEGHCVICGKETKWNEETWRYDKFCGPDCRKKAAEIAKRNMIKVYGKESLLGDDEQQRKMLANRSISGVYKMTSGGALSYTGSYERKLLEFLDTVMHYHYVDILSPGPTIEYEFEGKKHFWITDQFIVPYNLAIDVKDGGDNPNNREMETYRAKQDAKEAAIIKQGKYNYLRLTNNNFAQLLSIMMEIKEQMMDIGESNKPIIHINEGTNIEIDENCLLEYSAASCGPVIGAGEEKTFIVQAINKNSLNNEPLYGVSKDRSLSTVYMCGEDKEMTKMDWESLKENYDVWAAFEFIPSNGYKPNPNGRNIAEVITGKTFLTPDQLFYDDDFQQIATLDDMLELAKDSLSATLKGQTYKIPIVEENTINADSDIMYYEDENGIFMENIKTHLRSKSYESLESISEIAKQYIEKGMI